MSDHTTKERILIAAISIVEREGIGAIRMRRIASDAGVNTAAVNYHFGSRANLISAVLHASMGHAVDDWAMVMRTEGLGPAARLHCLLHLLLEGISRYPGMVRTHLFDPDVRDLATAAFAREFSSFLDMAAEELGGQVVPAKGSLRLSLAQMITSTITVALIPDLFRAATGGNLPEHEARELHVSNLIRCFTGLEPNFSPLERSIIDGLMSQAFSGSGVRGVT
ncbi:MAG: TetR/AcrR family transcriptional regulator [Candidatus Fermentibacteraceae bacterium]